MISFLTLFLGLLVGPHDVALAVGPEVAEVRLLLDGRQVAALESEPWRAKVNFGDRLRPHELVAVALDAAGEEIARSRQWINRPRGRAESTLLLEQDADGRPKALRLIWENLVDLHPLDVSVTLNGRRLEDSGGGVYPLPSGDDFSELQVAVAEVEFEEGPTTRAELVFGGPESDHLEVEMTAVPVRHRGADRELRLDDLRGRLIRRGGGELRPLGLERGRARVVTVVERGAYRMLGAYAQLLDRGGAFNERRLMKMRPGDSFLSQAPVPVRRLDGGTPLDLFTISPAYGPEHGDLPFLISHATPGEVPDGVQQLADAVAVAGVEAAAGDRPRAVLLIVGHKWEDKSRFEEKEVASFLAELRVPLSIWATGPARTGVIAEDRLPLKRKTAWGLARDISTFNRFQLATGELRRELDEQAIAWIAGAHLPQQIELAGRDRRLELAR
ncbi:MAG: hypothetical protein R3325_04505 [Thermoanaerobaculia bacterium]|nr:hypothetical protein [Thermoanaerobaculia bacterium]